MAWRQTLSRLDQQVKRAALDLLFPPECALCHQDLPPQDARAVCRACLAELVTPPCRRCLRCGTRVPEGVALGEECFACRDVSLRFESVLPFDDYQGLLRTAVLMMKHAAREPVTLMIGKLVAERFDEQNPIERFDQVLPIPMHWWRRLRRGTNNPDLIASAVASKLGVPVDLRGLIRVRNTDQQTTMAPSLREDNLRGAFALRAGRVVKGQTILIVDDILTTGATCNEAARVLLRAGAQSVHVCVVARARSTR